MEKMVASRFFGMVVPGSSVGKLDAHAVKLAAMGYEIEVSTPDSFSAFLDGRAVVEADCADMDLNIEKFTWNEYFGCP